jgi:hypothetical protein
MYFLVETIDQLNRLDPKREAFVHVIPNNYDYHPKLAKICAYYYRADDKGYVFPIDHSDCFSLNNSDVLNFLSKHDRLYTVDKKYHSNFLNQDKLVDMSFECVRSKDLKTSVQHEFQRLHAASESLSSIIPIVKHYEHCERLFESYKNCIGKQINQSLNRVIEAYSYVESNPIKIDRLKFFEKFKLNREKLSLDGDLLYNQYNLHNQTGRPTNSFNGVNFLAIPKDEEHRSCFVASNDYFVEFDFDAYHLRLIANEVGYRFDTDSVHTYLGKHYFGKESLTDEEYKESKTISFRNLYGGVPEAHQHVGFFKAMSTLAKKISSGCAPGDSMELPTGMTLVRDGDMNENKLLNYYVQNLETKRNADKILKINALLEGKLTKLVLITYDAFLLDYSVSDGKQLLIDVKKILEEDNMKVKHKFAKNYFL